jgi:hypothetical protein
MPTFYPLGKPEAATEWPSREEWAKMRRTPYADMFGDVHVSETLSDYASPAEIDAVIAEARALWDAMGVEMKKLGPAMSDREWRELYHSMLGDREKLDKLMESDACHRIALRDDRSDLNRRVIKLLRKNWLPRHFGLISWEEKLPKLVELRRRYDEARDAAVEARKREIESRPIDDAAWESELRRRASVKAWLAGDRFTHRT